MTSGAPEPDGTAVGSPYWVNPGTSAAQQVGRWEKEGRHEDARLMERIARQPIAEWIGTEDPGGEAREYTEAATAAGRIAVLVVYNIPHRDCGQYSRGGAADGDEYRRFVDQVALGIGDRKATVVLEPDAVMHLVDDCTPARFHEERYALLAYAVERLTARPGTTVYLDAGNAVHPGDPGALAQALRRSGIDKADGFAVNTSNYYTTGASAEYGRVVSPLVGGKPFVIDTSRNGLGPLPGDDADKWCNPPGRGAGTPPTEETGDELVDAYLWIKTPGDSDGQCRGGPQAGEWWPQNALELARNAKG